MSMNDQSQTCSLGVRICVALIRSYRAILSPRLGLHCRFEPTCSEYARQAIERYGVIRGITLTWRRLWRCRPGFAGGHDPVPDEEYFSLPTFQKARTKP
jgi:putative membrane protein insertion efficiency factor